MRQLTKEQGHLAARRMMQASWELSQRLQRGEHPQATRITTPPPPSLAPVPRAEWPAWAKTVSLLSKPQDVGVGDTVARTIGPATSETFKAWYQTLFKATCGCERRQAEWNARFPYQTTNQTTNQTTPNTKPKP